MQGEAGAGGNIRNRPVTLRVFLTAWLDRKERDDSETRFESVSQEKRKESTPGGLGGVVTGNFPLEYSGVFDQNPGSEYFFEKTILIVFCFKENRFNSVIHFPSDFPEQRSCGKIITRHFINDYCDIHITVFPLIPFRIGTEQNHFLK